MLSDCYLATMVKMYWATRGYKGWNHCHEISKISTVIPEHLLLRGTNKPLPYTLLLLFKKKKKKLARCSIYSCFFVTSFILFCCSEHHNHAYMDTQHSGKHRHPLLKPGQKYRVVGGLTGEQRPREVFGQSKAHPQARVSVRAHFPGFQST